MKQRNKTVLIHLASGIGNIVLATPLLTALARARIISDVLVHGDYTETADLLRGWSAVNRVIEGRSEKVAFNKYDHVIPAIPPFYWNGFKRHYIGVTNAVRRPADSLFYKDEQAYYFSFAQALGTAVAKRPPCSLPIGPSEAFGVTARTVVLAPGSKTGEMAAKRWPFFAELAGEFDDVAIVGTADDHRGFDGKPLAFPRHARSFVGRLSLRETAELMASAGVVAGNDSGLSHVAAAVGTPTVMIFGPTPHTTLGALPANVRVLRSGMECEPCWFNDRFNKCARRIDCLHRLSVSDVVRTIGAFLED